MHNLTRARIIIRGAVQGVGFRPFVYRLASHFHLNGWVSNTAEGVYIEAEGAKVSLDEFLIRLSREHPRHASIQSFECSFHDAVGLGDFQIRHSEEKGAKRALILPDIATCPECLDDIFDPSNRRYLYPFTNCTNCGPRFTIIEKLPYDRANTTMHHFDMCVRCHGEYEDPYDRRFHAQPNACPECGPQLEIWDTNGVQIARHTEAIRHAVDAVLGGLILAMKGLGGFHLMVDATNDDAVCRLRARKHREEKPFAVMAPSVRSLEAMCRLNALERRLLVSPESPIIILSRRADSGIVDSVAPRNPYLGVMLPYTPLHHIFMRKMARPVVATSGNHSDEPIAIDEHDAIVSLRDIADLFLVHNRPIRRHADDSIVRVILGREQILRRARGYAPLPIIINDPVAPTLAVGGHLKNTVALAVENKLFLSQHIGDLETNEALGAFRQVIADFQTLYDVRAEQIAADMHPDYASASHARNLAESAAIEVDLIQHHHAHVLSCMADNAIDPPALGVAWDGTGYGPDGTIWGGEFLRVTNSRFDRVAHFRTFPLPGGDASIKNPKQALIGLLYEMLGAEAFNGDEPPLLRQMLEKRVRCPETSSVGRLFDAVASLIGIRDRVSFEGQAAMELEFAAASNINEAYDYVFRPADPLVIDWEPMIRQIIHERRSRGATATIAAKFQNTLAAIVVDVALRLRESRVLLSGGCFQNRYLTERTVQQLTAAGFHAYWHQRVPPNDGGIALGQIVAAQQKIQQEKSCVLQSLAK